MSRVRKIDELWFELLSELFVNLAAGWFGAVFIVPNFVGINPPFNIIVLTMDVMAGILSLGLAYLFKKRTKRK